MTDNNRPSIPPIKRIKRTAEEAQQKRIIRIPPPAPRHSDTTSQSRAPIPPIRMLTGSTTYVPTQAKPRGQVTVLGEDTRTGEQIAVDDISRCSGCYIIGTQGVGKSSLLEHMIYQDIAKGYPVIVLDPHGQLIDNIISRMPAAHLERTYLLDLTDEAYPFGFNIFACRDIEVTRERNITRNRVMSIFEKVWPSENRGLLLPMLLQAVTETLMEHAESMTMADIPALLLDGSYRAEKVASLRNRRLKEFWELEYNTNSVTKQRGETAPLRTRLNDWLADSVITNIICQKEATIDFREAIENREILLIKLPTEQPGYERAARIIGTMMLAQIYAATFSFQDMPEAKRPGFSLYIDEFQYFATSDTARLFTGGRKYKVRQTLAHQTRVQLKLPEVEDATLSANTVISFKVIPSDSREVSPLFTDIDLYPGVQHIHADIFPRLKNHRNAAVTDFWSRYVRKWQEADEKNVREKTETGYYGTYKREVWPERDLGHGNIQYRPEWVREALDTLERLLLDAERRQKVNESYRAELINQVCGFLKFGNYLIDCIQSGQENPDHSEKLWYDMFTSSLDACLVALIQEPIGERRETDKTAIEQYLIKLEKRHALASVSQTTYPIKTLPLVPGVSPTEITKRIQTIQARTRSKYCRSREEVEAELEGIEEDEEDTLPPSNSLQKLANPVVAVLAPIRRDIEALIKPLYEKNTPKDTRKDRIGLSGMVKSLRNQGIIDRALEATLLEIIATANTALHEDEGTVKPDQATRAISLSQGTIAALTRILQTDTVDSTWNRFEPLE